jgi:NADP-dependent 3-hydroxy acid dehydrogenase YdfG
MCTLMATALSNKENLSKVTKMKEYLLRNVVITGASRGIGLEMVKQLASNPNCNKIVASCRNPDKAKKLLELKEKYPQKILVKELNVNDIKGFPDFVESIKVRIYFSISCRNKSK